MFSKFKRSNIWQSVGAVALVLYGILMAQVVTIFVLQALGQIGLLSQASLNSTAVQFYSTAAYYSLALVIIIGLFCMVRNSTKGLSELLAVAKAPRPSAIYFALVGYASYFALSFLFIVVTQILLTGFNLDQKQEVGFDQLGNQLEYIMAFVALVILAPVAEEAIFRGFLFSRLRKYLNFWWVAVVVSLVFGLIHMQWNVAIDVFALSLILCFLREKTGSIWAGVGVHILKNALAFAILFWQLDIEKIILRLV